MRKIIGPAVIGVLSAGFGVAVAELLAAATRPQAGPLVAVGGAIIDATPTPVKEFAVRELGTNDKPVLLGSIALVLALFTAVVGILAVQHRSIAVVGAALFGAAGAFAALSRPAATAYDAVPSVLGAVVAGVTLLFLLRRAFQPDRVEARPGLAGAAPSDGAGAGRPAHARALRPPGVPALGLPGGRRSRARRRRLGDHQAGPRRRHRRIPRGHQAARRGASPPSRCPAGVAPGFATPNADFYRVDTALTIPRIDVDTWSLRIHGMVGQEAELSFADLLNRPLIERDITLNCVSNEVGGPYIGTARWLGVPLAPLLREIGIEPGADQVVARSVEGMTIGTPVQTVLDGRDTMLCVGMNGEPLPLEHGFPVRMLTPGLYGYAGACKWLTEIELTTFADFDAYWVQRKWGARGPVKTASRIDKPQPFAQLKAGTQTVAGVAWAQGRGIKAVEVRVDDGPWETGRTAAGAVRRHLGAVALRLDRRRGRAHADGPGDRQHRRGADRGAGHAVPGRRDRLAQHHRDSGLTLARTAAVVRSRSPVASRSSSAPRSTASTIVGSPSPAAVRAAVSRASQSSTDSRANPAHGPSGSISERAYASTHRMSSARCSPAASHDQTCIATSPRSPAGLRSSSSRSSARARASRARTSPSFEPNRYSSTRGLDPIAAASGRSDRSPRPCTST